MEGGNIVSLNGTVIIQMVNFLVFMVIIDRVLFKPMLTHLAKREDELKTVKVEVEGLRKNAEKLLQEYEALIAVAREKAKELLNAALKEAKEEKEKLLVKAQDEVQEKIGKAKEEIWASYEKEKVQLDAKAEEIAEKIVEKILKKAA